MRKLPAVLAVTALAVVSLAGCSAGAAQTCARPAGDSTLSSLVSVSGDTGAAPQVSVSTPFHASGTSVYDQTTGDGTEVVSDSQAVVLGMTVVDGATGKTLLQFGYDDLTDVQTVSTWLEAAPGLESALMCASAGSRVIVGLDQSGLTTKAADTLGITKGGSAVFVVDLRKVYLAAADGALQFNDARGLPTVVRAATGQPGIIIPDAPAPTEPVVQVLKKGSGAVPTSTDTIRVNYTTVSWDKRDVTNTSWGSAPVPVPLSGTDQITKALASEPVGSQVMVVVPAGTSSASSGAQVIVFDILGIDGQEG
ncbi:FKBP-type peptidyl-prolyl cis-trans isomerase [Microbacterium sp. SORGH_AS_0888]|uniref:FKBP-type peptidyl-prolyl cis-trans isomerase n=1 Tax=Microbacterium sp. SORGH_AS_0888 TaxID=3041791 RepID=UPI00277F960C|nr:hypothetical protein [Microbacterium sp. SORGH_AS_0888]MDQ1128463.1 hypothetical protein [Microbacterium sp. SORGH_AS_0888]